MLVTLSMATTAMTGSKVLAVQTSLRVTPEMHSRPSTLAMMFSSVVMALTRTLQRAARTS